MANRKMVPSKPHFFQPLLPGFEHQLSIPVAFFKYLNGQDCNRAVLRGRGGNVWPVRINGRRFENGWEKFVQDHDLHMGDFVVFRHAGDMVFDVMVFDPSACEREYPPVASKDIVVKEEVETSDEDLPKEISAREFTKKKQTSATFAEEASSPWVEHPHFLGTVQPYSLKKSRLHIPRKFARLYSLKNRHCKITLMDQHGRSWDARLRHKKSDGQVYIGPGWSAFCYGNDLKEGDSYVFELIEKEKHVILKMRGLPANPKNKAKKKRIHNNAQASSSSIKHPHFSATVKGFNLRRSQLNIPKKFAYKHGLTSNYCKMILKNEKGASWVVSVFKTKTGRVYIGRGWCKFARANGLREGDDFMLELVKGGSKPEMNFYSQG